MFPFSGALDLVDFVKFLNKDKSALSRLKFSRISTTYINMHGIAKYLKEEMVSKLMWKIFSLNFDEGTMIKLEIFLLGFYDDAENMIVETCKIFQSCSNFWLSPMHWNNSITLKWNISKRRQVIWLNCSTENFLSIVSKNHSMIS